MKCWEYCKGIKAKSNASVGHMLMINSKVKLRHMRSWHHAAETRMCGYGNSIK